MHLRLCIMNDILLIIRYPLSIRIVLCVKYILIASLSCMASMACAQYEEQHQTEPLKPFEHMEYMVEAQGSFSHGSTPLWLNANRYGLSSLESSNGYLRAGVFRPMKADEERRWAIGYGVDVAVPVNYTSHVVVQQAFVEGRWLHGALTIGAKEQPIELKDNMLSSGAQTLGHNARPVPQVRLSLPDYWTVPLTNGWLHVKGHVAFGQMTDDAWQHEFTGRQRKYADDVLYHSKAGYLKIGNEERFCPWSLELGLEMACLFGGTAHIPDGDGLKPVKGGTALKDFWRALVPGGAEKVEEGTYYQNAKGNQLGSWLARVNYDSDSWRFSVYADKFFEDHSSMLLMDYDGYGKGYDWNVRDKHRYFVYGLKDWLLGMEYHRKYDGWLNTIVLEYLYTKYQSGPVYHDHSPGRPDSHIGGMDNFYNHYVYPGWQHWGQAIGNPLYRAPLYNNNGEVEFQNNRFMAFHAGFDGQPIEQFGYRILATWQEGLGTYIHPYYHKRHDFSFLLEGVYQVPGSKKWLRGMSVTAGYGMDFGSLLGGMNYGFQLTLTKRGLF